ncbi:hypothetical protein [Streptomyces sp. NPDC097610]|uniref:hypothetical protein n=1 Tax=Streptomyces sp. NPDC097610 TaxID=3157227 RepID=UPI00332B9CDE
MTVTFNAGPNQPFTVPPGVTQLTVTATGAAGQNGPNGGAGGSGDGNDQLSGGDGNDRIEGGNGADSLNGNNGDDALFGGPGTNTNDGGTGSNACFNPSAVPDWFTDRRWSRSGSSSAQTGSGGRASSRRWTTPDSTERT